MIDTKYGDTRAPLARWKFPVPYKCPECEGDKVDVYYRTQDGKWIWCECPECGFAASMHALERDMDVALEPSTRGLPHWYPQKILSVLVQIGLVDYSHGAYSVLQQRIANRIKETDEYKKSGRIDWTTGELDVEVSYLREEASRRENIR